MSLSSLYASLREAQGQVSYWQTSANTYSTWITETQAQIDHKEKQLQLANEALAKCNELMPLSADVTTDTMMVALGVGVGFKETDAQTAINKLDDDNDDYIDQAIDACNALISELETELEQLYAQLATYQEGLSYSNGRVSYYQGRVSSIQYSIATYDED